MAAPLAAQQVYTLDECIESALLNNARMKNAANDLASARHERKEAFTNYFPTISPTSVLRAEVSCPPPTYWVWRWDLVCRWD